MARAGRPAAACVSHESDQSDDTITAVALTTHSRNSKHDSLFLPSVMPWESRACQSCWSNLGCYCVIEFAQREANLLESDCNTGRPRRAAAGHRGPTMALSVTFAPQPWPPTHFYSHFNHQTRHVNYKWVETSKFSVPQPKTLNSPY